MQKWKIKSNRSESYSSPYVWKLILCVNMTTYGVTTPQCVKFDIVYVSQYGTYMYVPSGLDLLLLGVA